MRVFLVLAFLLVPLAEIAVLIRVGQVVGPWWTILLLIAMSVLGTWLVRREWRGTWRALTEALASGRLPSRELVDAGLVLVGGTLLLTPGFLSDLVGLLVLLPLTRPLARKMVMVLLARRVRTHVAARAAVFGTAGGLSGMSGARGDDRPGFPRSAGPTVVRGEVLDDPGPPVPEP